MFRLNPSRKAMAKRLAEVEKEMGRLADTADKILAKLDMVDELPKIRDELGKLRCDLNGGFCKVWSDMGEYAKQREAFAKDITLAKDAPEKD